MADVIYAVTAGDCHSRHSDWKTFDGSYSEFEKEQRFWAGNVAEGSSPIAKKAEDVVAETKITVDDNEPWVLYPLVRLPNQTLRFYIRQSQLTK